MKHKLDKDFLMTTPPEVDSDESDKNGEATHTADAAGGLALSVKDNSSSCSSSPKLTKRLELNVKIPEVKKWEDETIVLREISTKKRKRKKKKLKIGFEAHGADADEELILSVQDNSPSCSSSPKSTKPLVLSVKRCKVSPKKKRKKKKKKGKKPRDEVKSPLEADPELANVEGNDDAGFLSTTTFPTTNCLGLQTVQTPMLDYSLVIPPLPKSYDVWDMSMYFAQPEVPPLSREKENELLLQDLRQYRFFRSRPIDIPKLGSSWVKCYGFTTEGTILIRFKDEWNEAHFKNLADRLRFCAATRKQIGLDAQILMDDVKVGLLVMAYIERKDSWIRARINKFSHKWIEVSGVDEFILSERLRYEDVSYLHKDLYGCPFAIQECYLSGLEKWKGSTTIRLIWSKLEGILLMNKELNEMKNPEDDTLSTDSDEDDDVYDDGLDLFTEDFWISEIKKRKRRYYVKIEFPENFASELTVNDWMKGYLKQFDPLQDLQRTP